ncbi:gamma-aminobutyric acid receptor subunit rho-2-like [Galendromus occidentalis]|uniref:Gamma-aminobutyric acid receptor subunit rho-2-like n=1 Tax=Galendromus occidentalis TaxID=34638 RepID=A0AAJ7P938_9ACAR|nr:gamma-aminobutyric acid receptor subunit rho-2-like [Galendromus occidentalis]XP_018497668.1 gamma-aminobutyric acid receptor subunit rho-2-like [Galendromus occidentalis]
MSSERMEFFVRCISVVCLASHMVRAQGDEDAVQGAGETTTEIIDEDYFKFPSMTAQSRAVYVGLTVLVNHDFDIDLTFAMDTIINETVCPNYYNNMSKAYAASAPTSSMDTFINERVPIVSEVIAYSYFFPDLFVTEATTVSYPSRVLPLKSTRYFEYDFSGIPCYPFYKQRRIMTLSCSLQFTSFPLDEQICSMTISNFAYNAAVMRLFWNNSDGSEDCVSLPKKSYGSLFVNPAIKLSEFYLEVSEGAYESTATINRFPICGLSLQLIFKRNILNSLLGAILPSCLLVYVSFGVFLIPSEARTERVTLSITTFLTLVTIYSSTRLSVPQSGQITYADIWMIACLVTVLMVTMECCLVEQLNTSEADFEARRKRRDLDLRVKDDLFRYVQRFDRDMPTQTIPAIRGQPDYRRPPTRILRDIADKTDQRDLFQAVAGILAYIQRVVPWYRLPWTADRIERWARWLIIGGFTFFCLYFWIHVLLANKRSSAK